MVVALVLYLRCGRLSLINGELLDLEILDLMDLLVTTLGPNGNLFANLLDHALILELLFLKSFELMFDLIYRFKVWRFNQFVI